MIKAAKAAFQIQVIPAIDLIGGSVVRLLKGNYQHIQKYSEDPLKVALGFKTLGFEHLHIIDLDGAKEGRLQNLPHIEKLIKSGFSLQVGGGIRTLEDVTILNDIGVKRIILGTQAILNPAFYHQAVSVAGSDKIVLSLDIDRNFVAIKGWTSSSGLSLEEVLANIGTDQICHLIVTDICRDGTLLGCDAGIYRSIKNRYPAINLIAAGGVTSLDDLQELQSIGLREAIMGRTIYENPGLLEQIVARQEQQNGD